MLNITNVVSASAGSCQGCGKNWDNDCGRNARHG